MEPLQGQARTAILRKFLLLYGISLVIIFAVVYFAFNTPAIMFRKSIQQYKIVQGEQKALLDQTDAITTYLNEIMDADRSFKPEMSVPDKERLKEALGSYTNALYTALEDFQNDTSNLQTEYSKRHAIHYMFMFNNFLEYRTANAIDYDNLESDKNQGQLFKRARDSMRAYQVQRDNLRLELARLGSRSTLSLPQVVATPNNNNEATTRSLNAKIEELDRQIRQLQVDLTYCNQQKASLSQSAASQPQVTPDLSKQQLASVLEAAARKIYNQAKQGKNFRGGTIEQRAFYSCAKMVFEDAREQGGSAEIANIIRDIEAQIKKLTN